MYARVVKRLLDIILSCVALIVMILPMLLIALAIKIDDPGATLFRQRRVGQSKDGQTTFFSLWKFRSMKLETPHEVPTHLLAHPERYITRVGGFLRRTSLDELPQLFQVLIGRMSLVGPRPALWNQEDLIAERERYGANDVKPGLTGWAQVNGRDELPIIDKARLDGLYAATLRAGHGRGLAMDVKCCLRTAGAVLRAAGGAEGEAGAKREESPSGDRPRQEKTDEMI